jgi:hypothetical protein
MPAVAKVGVTICETSWLPKSCKYPIAELLDACRTILAFLPNPSADAHFQGSGRAQEAERRACRTRCWAWRHCRALVSWPGI